MDAGRFHRARVAVAVATMLLLTATADAQRPTKPGYLTNYPTGDANDAPTSAVGGPAVLVMGGGPGVDAAFINRAFPIVNGGDIAVLRVSGSNGYQSYFYSGLIGSGPLQPDSVETMIVDSAAKANEPYVKWVIETAEMVWMAGGDQSDYINYWKGTAVEDAVRTVYNNGGVVGGTSAGAVVSGQYMYDPDGVTSVQSADAIANPYRSNIILETDLFNTTLSLGMMFDSHLLPGQRDTTGRMGREAAFMARLRHDGTAPSIIGVGLAEATSMFINSSRVGYVDILPPIGAEDAVFVLWEDGQTLRTRVISGQPLIYENILRARLTDGNSFDFNSMTQTGGALRRLTVNGDNSPPYSLSDPYAVPVQLSGFAAD